jgi:hypothetical protein
MIFFDDILPYLAINFKYDKYFTHIMCICCTNGTDRLGFDAITCVLYSLAGSLRNAGGTNSAKFIHFVDYI